MCPGTFQKGFLPAQRSLGIVGFGFQGDPEAGHCAVGREQGNEGIEGQNFPWTGTSLQLVRLLFSS